MRFSTKKHIFGTVLPFDKGNIEKSFDHFFSIWHAFPMPKQLPKCLGSFILVTNETHTLCHVTIKPWGTGMATVPY
jgi:hypothetical protein